MPHKLFSYLTKHCLVGLALSSVTVIGFTYFLLLPGTEGNILERLTEATEQMMLISHLIMPLVVLIGLSYGLGLLHNHSEIITILQKPQSLGLVAGIVIFFGLSGSILELTVWPSLQHRESTSNTSWQRQGDIFNNNETKLKVNGEGRINGAIHHSQAIGDQVTLQELESVTYVKVNNKTNLLSLFAKRNIKVEAYAFWKEIYQSLWALPVFVFLFLKLKTVSRGSSAANITAAVAITAITAGLFGEAIHIILSKALITPILTALIPVLCTVLISGYRSAKI